jgi:DNA-binding NarL/FixJ family response regulator
MARALALTRDLLFGSRVQAALGAAGHEVELVDGEQRLRARLGDRDEHGGGAVDALIVDLTDDELDGARVLTQMPAGALDGVRTLAYYSHVDAADRERAARAGFDVVVPRSRMAREAGELIDRLLAGS